MHILHLSRRYYPHVGGVETHVAALTKELVRQGHTNTILTVSPSGRGAATARYQGSDIVRIPEQVLSSKWQLWRAIAEHKELFLSADSIHAHDVFWWILPLYPSIWRKVHVTFHGYEGVVPVRWQAKLHRLIISWLARSRIHVGDFIRQFYWDKPDFVTYGGVTPSRTASSLEKTVTSDTSISAFTEKQPLRIVFVGRLDQDLAIAEYQEVLRLLQKQGLPATITWVGDGELRESCAATGTVTGFVPRPSKYIDQADVVFASSYLSILEAQVRGKLVCGLYTNPLKKAYLTTFPASKYMVLSGKPSGLVRKLTQLLSSQRRWRVTVDDAQQFARQQTWEAVAQIYLQAWNVPNSRP